MLIAPTNVGDRGHGTLKSQQGWVLRRLHPKIIGHSRSPNEPNMEAERIETAGGAAPRRAVLRTRNSSDDACAASDLLGVKSGSPIRRRPARTTQDERRRR